MLKTLGILLAIAANSWALPKGKTAAPGFSITSPSFREGDRIPQKHSGDGVDRSPALAWSGAPAGTKELALICDDPDAPSPAPWVHWLLYGMTPTARSLPEGVPTERSVTLGEVSLRQGTNSFGTIGYRGPTPPPGKAHRYFFKLFAVEIVVGLPSGATKEELLAAIRGHILAETQLMGKYSR